MDMRDYDPIPKPVTCTLIRPWSVLKVQLRLFLRWFSEPSVIRAGRTVTYSEDDLLGPFLIRRHYVQISKESGEVLYKSPNMTVLERKAFIRRVEAINEFYRKEKAGYDF